MYRRVDSRPAGSGSGLWISTGELGSGNVKMRGFESHSADYVYSLPKGNKAGWWTLDRLIQPAGWTGFIHRAVDVAGACLLLVLLFPLLLIVAIAIKIDSHGPVFFVQERHGRRGTTFKVYKFRTMRVMESGLSATQCRKDDPRVTRLGVMLRKASLDELPQLMNVLRGEMALVGPRPHPISLDREFAPRIRRYRQRYWVKPGMTGLAQIRGHRGPTVSLAEMATRVAIDIEYVRSRSLVLDLRILFMTIPAVLGGRNAF